MPPPIDLTGKKIGALTVIERAGKVKFGRAVTAWRCRCDCGREEVIPQPRLPYKDYIAANKRRAVWACSVCRLPDCVECGKKVPLARKHRNTCSDKCSIKHRRNRDLKSYYRRFERDPELNRKRRALWLKKLSKDPEKFAEYKKKENERAKQKWRHIKSDPILHQTELKKQRERYHADKARIQRSRRRRISNMTPEQREKWQEMQRRHGRHWRRRWRRHIFSDPKLYTEYLSRMREYRRNRELRTMAGDAARILERKDEDR